MDSRNIRGEGVEMGVVTCFFVFAEGWVDYIFRENREGIVPN